MSTITVCDFCGRPIEDGYSVRLQSNGYMPGESPDDWEREDETLGHFHSQRVLDDGRSCYGKMLDALNLALDSAPNIENLETISNHQVAARRRKHRRAG